MEYVHKDGTKVIVNGDEVQYGENAAQKNLIGANFTHGIFMGAIFLHLMVGLVMN